jgi:hypothetical protein
MRALRGKVEVVSEVASEGAAAGCGAVTGACRRVDRAKQRREGVIDEVGDKRRRARGDSMERRMCGLAIHLIVLY